MTTFSCGACGASYGLPDQVRAGARFSIRCHVCGAQIHIEVPSPGTSSTPPLGATTAAAERRRVLEEHVRLLDLSAIKAAVAKLPSAAPTSSGVTSSRIEAFEARWGIVLPDEYRAFLLTVGDGAPGPWGGLIPLGYEPDPSTGELVPLSEEIGARIREPFKGSTDGAESELAEERDDGDPREEATWDGVLPLAWGGDTMWAWLVVTGPERGRVWETESGSWFPAATPLCRPVTFREWYAVWLCDAQPTRAAPVPRLMAWLRRVTRPRSG